MPEVDPVQSTSLHGDPDVRHHTLSHPAKPAAGDSLERELEAPDHLPSHSRSSRLKYKILWVDLLLFSSIAHTNNAQLRQLPL